MQAAEGAIRGEAEYKCLDQSRHLELLPRSTTPSSSARSSGIVDEQSVVSDSQFEMRKYLCAQRLPPHSSEKVALISLCCHAILLLAKDESSYGVTFIIGKV